MQDDIIPDWVYYRWAQHRRRELFHVDQLERLREKPELYALYAMDCQAAMVSSRDLRLVWERRIANAMVMRHLTELDTPLFTARLTPVPESSRTELVIEVKEA